MQKNRYLSKYNNIYKLLNRDTKFIKVSKTMIVKKYQNKSSCITAGGNSGGNHSDMDLLIFKNYIRRYFVIEFKRLQNIKDNYSKYGLNKDNKKYKISNSQRYKMIGNT